MHQYYAMFNAARIPARQKDVIQRFFCTEREGQCSSEVVVLCRGNVWIIETMQNNEVLPPDIFLHQLKYIYEHSKVVRYSILSLTTLQRDQWADARIHLQSLSESNASNLARIEQTIFAISLTDETFSHSDDVIRYGLTGDARAQWVDKSMNFFFPTKTEELEHKPSTAMLTQLLY
uniref:Peroxisomal carnitine O-octanoyltransferase n=1 Tax=Ascaris suum TaxID=6253 RepID=F1LEM7_ASCSU